MPTAAPIEGNSAAKMSVVSENGSNIPGARSSSLSSKRVRWTGEDIGAGWIDTTDESIERAKGRLTELNDLLTEAGAATVVKPSAL